MHSSNVLFLTFLALCGCSEVDTPRKSYLVVRGLNFDDLMSLREDLKLKGKDLAPRLNLNKRAFLGFSSVGFFIYKEPERNSYWLFRNREDAELGFFERGFSVGNSNLFSCEAGYYFVSGKFFLEASKDYNAGESTIIVDAVVRVEPQKGTGQWR
jgi:hypothetical protein